MAVSFKGPHFPPEIILMGIRRGEFSEMSSQLTPAPLRNSTMYFLRIMACLF